MANATQLQILDQRRLPNKPEHHQIEIDSTTFPLPPTTMANHSVRADAAFLQQHELHKDQLIHLQCSDLCQESHFKRSHRVDSFFDDLSKILSQLAEPNDLIKLPTVQPTTANRAILKASSNARVLPTFRYTVLIPTSTLKDFREDAYFDQRSKCVSKIAKHLHKNRKQFTVPVQSVTWRYWKEDRRKREVLLTTAKFRCVVQVGIESLDWIQPPVRLVPNRNNLSKGPPTTESIHYNFCLTEDFVHDYGLDLIDEFANAEPAMMLFQVWALQRGLWRGVMDVDDTTALLLYAYRTKRANARMTPLQVLIAAWKLLSEEDSWVRVIPSPGKSESQTVAESPLAQRYAQLAQYSPLTSNDPPTLVALWKEQCEFFPVSLLDSSLRHNFCARWRYHWSSIRREAEISLQESSDYRGLFLETRRFWTRHDAYCRLEITDGKKLDRDKVLGILRKALGTRVVDLQIWATGNGVIGSEDSDSDDSDEIPSFAVSTMKESLHDQWLVLGFTVDPDVVHFVDRGPPMEDTKGVADFRALWGKKAELRRFKDGAIIYAVVWDTIQESLSNSNRWQAELVERVVQHVIEIHFQEEVSNTPTFAWKDLVSVVDGFVAASENTKLTCDAMAAHRSVIGAFEDLSNLLKEQTSKTIRDGKDFRSPLGLPLSIDAVEPLSPALRYAELFPPLPHPLLGGKSLGNTKKVSGAVCFNPIEIQIRFGSSSKWPNDLKAIGAAKTAMLIELTRGLEQLPEFKGIPPAIVTPYHADLCFKGYNWRIFVRADPELKLLRSLTKPTDDAIKALTSITRHAVVAASHHTMVHAVYTSNPSSSAVFRLVKRWLSTHLIQIPLVALELMICHLYERGNKPGTVFRGFERWLNLLVSFDWLKEPLIVDPQSHLSNNDRAEILDDFHRIRGESFENGPTLYIVSPCDRVVVDETGDKAKTSWMPYFAVPNGFERVMLCRAVALANRTHQFIEKSVRTFDDTSWPVIFTESPDAFRSYSALLRIDTPFLVNVETSSTAKHLEPRVVGEERITSFTKSMRSLNEGPKALKRTLYRNLARGQSGILFEWNPVSEAIRVLRRKLSDHALLLYNDLCPEVVAVVWRQQCHSARPFSAVTSECMRPSEGDMVVFNARDAIREIKKVMEDIISDIRVFDYGLVVEPQKTANKSKKRTREESDESDEESKAKAQVMMNLVVMIASRTIDSMLLVSSMSKVESAMLPSSTILLRRIHFYSAS